MQENLQVHNSRFITYTDELFTIDVLGGIDLQQMERMIATLRVTYKNYPPLRSTLDLYNDNQTDKLIRTLCDKWELQLLEVSKTVHSMINGLESYKLQKLQYPNGSNEQTFEQSEAETQQAKQYLADHNLIQNLQNDLQHIGVLGEEKTALILFLAMASHQYQNPFSVLCLAKSGMGKSYLLQKLADCMPDDFYSFHTQMSENALYYFDSSQIDGKVLFIEDLEWTQKMLMPLSTLQTQGRLVKTRATKDKDGMLHSTTFEVAGKLCLIACAYSERNYDRLSLPFLCLNLNHSHKQDVNVMEYQKKVRAGLINQEEIHQTQRKLKCVLASLENVSIINPYAPLIELPEDLPHPRKTLLLLLNFIDVITFFFQYQREQVTNEETGELLIKTHPNDIELAFDLLKNPLFRRADELSTTARGFYNWLKKYLNEANTNQFTALDIRKARSIHPRTLNRYLQELKLFSYVQVIGGNKHREGYRYKLTDLNELKDLQNGIESSLKKTLDKIEAEHTGKSTKEQTTAEPEQMPQNDEKKEAEPVENRPKKRVRIEEKEQHTLKLILELEQEKQGREYLPTDLTAITGRNKVTEARHLKTLWEQGKLNRERKDRQYYYKLPKNGNDKTSSKTVSQNPVSNPTTQVK